MENNEVEFEVGCDGDRKRHPSDKSGSSDSRKLSFSQHRPERRRPPQHLEKEVTQEVKAQKEEEEEVGEGHHLLSLSASSLCSSTSGTSSEGELEPDSRYTSSYATEYTDDSLTGALDNRVCIVFLCAAYLSFN